MARRYRHAYLTAALVLAVFVRPFVTQGTLREWLLEALLLLTMGAAAYSLGGRKRRTKGMIGLAVGASLLRIGWLIQGDTRWMLAFLLLAIPFYIGVVWVLLRSMFRPNGRVTSDTLLGAFSGYLLIALIWTMAYSALEMVVPGSFTSGQSSITQMQQFERFIGFSFATLTTVGYGNLAPATPRADALSSLEAVIGQFYMAVVIARLVAMQIIQATAPSKPHN